MSRIERRAQAMASSRTNAIFPRSSSGPDETTRATAGPVWDSGGYQAGPSRSSPATKAQSRPNDSINWRTTGPSRLKCVSRTGSAGLVAITFSSPMFMPPQNPTRPSTTSSFLCVRRLRNGIRHGRGECMKRPTRISLRRSWPKAAGRKYPLPIPSRRTRTSTPRALASARASKNMRPVASLRMM